MTNTIIVILLVAVWAYLLYRAITVERALRNLLAVLDSMGNFDGSTQLQHALRQARKATK